VGEGNANRAISCSTTATIPPITGAESVQQGGPLRSQAGTQRLQGGVVERAKACLADARSQPPRAWYAVHSLGDEVTHDRCHRGHIDRRFSDEQALSRSVPHDRPSLIDALAGTIPCPQEPRRLFQKRGYTIGHALTILETQDATLLDSQDVQGLAQGLQWEAEDAARVGAKAKGENWIVTDGTPLGTLTPDR